MKILIIKNKIKVPVQDDIEKAFGFLREKTPLTYELSYLETTLDLNFKEFIPGMYGTTGTKEALIPLIKEKYDIVIFMYGVTSFKINKGSLAGWTFWERIGGAEFIELPTNRGSDKNGWIWQTVAHETIHALCKFANRKGRPVIDEMDMTTDGKPYYKNTDPYATDGNFARTIKNLSVYWDVFQPKQGYRYFKDHEIKGLDPRLVTMLDTARGYAGVPFIITSGLRTAEHNERVGGVKDSAHLRGLAVDLLFKDSGTGGKILQGLVQAGFKRFGIYKDGHLHTDIDDSKTSPALWII